MDLDRHGQGPAANVILNRYLWRSRDALDLEGLAALPLFLALRAAVRAMVTIDRASQEGAAARTCDLDRARGYLVAALGYLEPPPPRLVAVGGLSGTGKTTLAAALAPSLGACPGAVHLRSDLERKALAGVGELDRLPQSAYAPDARRRIYQVLAEKARLALRAGHSVIVDAVHAGEEERQAIEAAAAGLGVSFRGLWLAAEAETLMARVNERSQDASDATAETVRLQLRSKRGTLSSAWTEVAAGGEPRETLETAAAALGLDAPAKRDDQRHDRPPP
jgi:predicted kinase